MRDSSGRIVRHAFRGSTDVSNAVLLALLAYAIWAWGDALTKSLGGGMPVLEMVFLISAFTAVPLLLRRPRTERWRDFWRMKRPWMIHTRAILGVMSGFCGVYAFTTIPLAEAYALIFLSPLFVTVLSVLLLKEHVGPWRWFAVIAGFCGVLLVVRPGFRELYPGHLAALSVALFFALSMILLRSVAAHEKYTSLFGTSILYNLGVFGVAAALTGFVVPTGDQLLRLMLVGACSAGGQMILLHVARFAPVNVIAPAHYSQIAWAVLLGAVFFAEYPDVIALAGLAVLAGAGLLTVVRERLRLGTVRWNPFFRNRL
jgi:drug/metabolite transporter (DMT)-like permease